MNDMLICIDCAMLHANADTSGIDSPEREAEVFAGLNKHPFIIVGDGWGFSNHPCDACGSRLAGDRYTATLP
jgi:hypothetical protein